MEVNHEIMSILICVCFSGLGLPVCFPNPHMDSHLNLALCYMYRLEPREWCEIVVIPIYKLQS